MKIGPRETFEGSRWMKLETPAEACAALAVLIAGADSVGTTEEGRYLYDRIAPMPVFGGIDRERFTKLMDEMTEWVWDSFPTDGGRMTDDGVAQLVDRIAAALPRDMRLDTLKAALGLARADGMAPEEEALLGRLCAGLEVDRSALA
jgi:tellurite resistance protein